MVRDGPVTMYDVRHIIVQFYLVFGEGILVQFYLEHGKTGLTSADRMETRTGVI